VIPLTRLDMMRLQRARVRWRGEPKCVMCASKYVICAHIRNHRNKLSLQYTHTALKHIQGKGYVKSVFYDVRIKAHRHFRSLARSFFLTLCLSHIRTRTNTHTEQGVRKGAQMCCVRTQTHAYTHSLSLSFFLSLSYTHTQRGQYVDRVPTFVMLAHRFCCTHTNTHIRT